MLAGLVWFSLVAKLPELYCARRVPQVTFISPALMHIVYSPRISAAALNGPYHLPICIEAGPVNGVGGTVLIYKGFLEQSVMSHDRHDQVEANLWSLLGTRLSAANASGLLLLTECQ
jgi:hypothetical protein